MKRLGVIKTCGLVSSVDSTSVDFLLQIDVVAHEPFVIRSSIECRSTVKLITNKVLPLLQGTMSAEIADLKGYDVEITYGDDEKVLGIELLAAKGRKYDYFNL